MDWCVDNYDTYLKNGDEGVLPSVDVSGLQPFVYVKDAINAILSEYDDDEQGQPKPFELVTDLDTDPEYKEIYESLAMSIPGSKCEMYDDYEFKGEYKSELPTPVSITSKFNFKNPYFDIEGPFEIDPNDDYTLLYKGFDLPGNYRFEVTMKGLTFGPVNIYVDHYTGDNKNDLIVKEPGTGIFMNTDSYSHSFKAHGKKGDNLRIKIVKDYPVFFSSNIKSLSIKCNEFTLDTSTHVPVGFYWPVVPNLPDMSQWDFFKEFLNFFGLSCKVDYSERKIHAHTLRYVDNQKCDPQTGEIKRDWTYKLDMRTEETEFDLGYAQKNILKYKEYSYTNDFDAEITVPDEAEFRVGTFENPEFNSDSDLITDDTLPAGPKTLWEFKACPAESVSRFGLDDIAKVRRIKNKEISGDAPLVFALLKKHTSSQKINFLDSETEDKQEFTIFYASFVDIEADKILKKFYDVLINKILRYPRKITVNMNLKTLDVSNFDHFVPVYLKQYGMFFYVNKIDKFRPDKLTKVELIKM